VLRAIAGTVFSLDLPDQSAGG